MIKYNLPYKRELEYIHLDGSVYFDLGRPLQDKSSRFSVVFANDETSAGSHVVFGDREYTALYIFTSGSEFYYDNEGEAVTTEDTYVKKTEVQLFDGKIFVNGHKIADDLTYTITPPTNLSVGGNTGDSSECFQGKIYSASLMNIFRNKEVKHEFYPVVTFSDSIKLYNSATGAFIDPSGLASSVITPGPTSHKHDALFTMDDFGNKLEEVPSTRMLLTHEDLAISYHSYTGSTLPDPKGDFHAIVLNNQILPYAKGQKLISVATATGRHWEPVGTPKLGVGAAYNVRSHQVFESNIVKIRWQDPKDVENRTWKYTRVLRKLGSYPTSIHDGVIVVDNTQRDHYNDRMLTDVQPPDITGVWYYRIFAVSDDGVSTTSEECTFVPIVLDWKNISTYIQAGKGPAIFGIGDVIEFTSGSGVYANLQLFVTGFDLVTPTNSRYRHSISFSSRCLLANLKYDIPWGDYRLVEDEIVVAGLKRYYVYDAALGGYKLANPQSSHGYHITAKDGYYLLIMDNRAKYGSNRWKECAMRKWLTATADYEYALSKDGSFISGKTYYKLNANETFSVFTETSPYGSPVSRSLYERGAKKVFFGNSAFTVKPPMVAFQEDIDADFAALILSTKQISALTQDDRVTGGDIADTTVERIYLPSIMEVAGMLNTDVVEGKFVTFYEEDSSRRIRAYEVGGTAVTWWTRSPRVDNPGVAETSRFTLKAIDEVGVVVNKDIYSTSGSTTSNVTAGVGLAFAIG